MPKTADVIDTRAYQAYEKRMEIARSGIADAKEKLSAAWWALYEIDRDELYRKAHGFSKVDWVRELGVHEGISGGDFYRVMKMIRAFVENKVPEKAIRDALGNQMTALKVDLAEAFTKKGKLLPEVKARIEQEYGSLAALVNTANGLGKGQARQLVKQLIGGDSIFALGDSVHFNPQRNELLVNVRWDGNGGLVGVYTLKLSVYNITEGVEVKDRKHLPEKLVGWLAGKLGVEL